MEKYEAEEKWKVLFVCGKNQWRSPTGEKIYANDQRMLVRSAGLSKMSKRTLAKADVRWAEVIFVMEQEQVQRIRQLFREDLEGVELVCLEIPDEYPYMDLELIERIKQGVESWWQE